MVRKAPDNRGQQGGQIHGILPVLHDRCSITLRLVWLEDRVHKDSVGGLGRYGQGEQRLVLGDIRTPLDNNDPSKIT